MAKPSLREFIEATGTPMDSWFYDQSNPQYEQNQKLITAATNALYGDVGANIDARDWDAIMASADPMQAAKSGLAAMYSDPSYREKNTANLATLGYSPAQAYYTYGQMNDRVGANYAPSASEVAAVESYFKDLGTPNYKWYVSPGKSFTSSSGSNVGGGAATSTNVGSNVNSQNGGVPQINAAPQVMGPLLSGGSGGGWNARQVVGAANGSMLGAGDANYHSSLIRSLRQNSMTPFSTNAGVLLAPNQGATTSNWTPAGSQGGGAFNPQVLNPRAASPQEIADWNAYSTYRTNSLNAKTPIVSFAEWLTGGKVDGQTPTNTALPPDYQYDPSLGGG